MSQSRPEEDEPHADAGVPDGGTVGGSSPSPTPSCQLALGAPGVPLFGLLTFVVPTALLRRRSGQRPR